jgi:hypothetical protein
VAYNNSSGPWKAGICPGGAYCVLIHNCVGFLQGFLKGIGAFTERLLTEHC